MNVSKLCLAGLAALAITIGVHAQGATGGDPLSGVVIGPDDGSGGPGFEGLTATVFCDPNPDLPLCALNFTLLSYTSEDTGGFDGPAVMVDGQLFTLPDGGGEAVPFAGGGMLIPDEFINNADSPAGPLDFSVILGPSVDPTGQPIPYAVALGVYSADNTTGPGIAEYADAFTKKVPAPGAFALFAMAGLISSRRRR